MRFAAILVWLALISAPAHAAFIQGTYDLTVQSWFVTDQGFKCSTPAECGQSVLHFMGDTKDQGSLAYWFERGAVGVFSSPDSGTWPGTLDPGELVIANVFDSGGISESLVTAWLEGQFFGAVNLTLDGLGGGFWQVLNSDFDVIEVDFVIDANQITVTSVPEAPPLALLLGVVMVWGIAQIKGRRRGVRAPALFLGDGGFYASIP